MNEKDTDLIDVRNVHKHFGDVTALDGASFFAGDRQITGLLGPNGAGKTTLLRILYTVIEQDSGDALVDGFDTRDSPLQVRKRIGVLPDSHGLYPRLTSRENIHYFGRLHGMSESVLAERTAELTDVLEMEDIVDRRTEGFSTGQRVKVAIARALVQSPQNIILDEPTSGLDVPSTRSMRSFIKALKDKGVCVLFSSHIMQEVAALCDQILIMSEGKIVERGSKESLLAKTRSHSLEDAFVRIIGSEEGLG